MALVNINIDGNYFYHRSVNIFKSMKLKKERDEIKRLKKSNCSEAVLNEAKENLYHKEASLLSPQNKNYLVRKLSEDFCAMIRPFGHVNKVIFTIDGHSWRKDVEIEENAGYKANRDEIKQASGWDWNRFFKEVSDPFTDVLRQFGVIVSTIPNGEGDDLIAMWSKYFLERGENCINITADQDIYQTVNIKDKNWVIIYNATSKMKKVVAYPGFRSLIEDEQKNMENATIFNFIDKNRDSLMAVNQVILSSELIEVEPIEHGFKKIFCGDDGDHVPAVYYEVKNNRKYKVTGKKYDKLLKIFLQKYGKIDMKQIYTDKSVRDFLAEVILVDIYKKDEYSKKLLETISDKIKRNVQLMYLDELVFPKSLVEAFEDHKLLVDTGEHINASSLYARDLLKDTNYFVPKSNKYNKYNNSNKNSGPDDLFNVQSLF